MRSPSARLGTTLWGSEQSLASSLGWRGCVRVSRHYSHTSYVSDKSLFLMSVSSDIYGKDNGFAAVSVPTASRLLLPACQAEPPVLFQS